VYLIFDMDGVIIDSAKLKIDALKMTFQALHMFIPKREISDKELLACHPHDVLQKFHDDFKEAVACHEKIHSQLRKKLKRFFSIDDFQYIKHKTLGVALFTAQPRHRLLDMLGASFLNIFDAIVTEDDVLPFIKPSPYGIELILQQQPHWNRSKTYFIGDTVEDIMSGRMANINTIAASWGFTSLEILVDFGCDWILDSPSDIFKLIEHVREAKCPDRMN
jgi:phosphoglycolate phosphatase-like HAD superfamily hydrolase